MLVDTKIVCESNKNDPKGPFRLIFMQICSKERQILSKEEQSHLDRSRKFQTFNRMIVLRKQI
jgi:hypothetical protein